MPWRTRHLTIHRLLKWEYTTRAAICGHQRGLTMLRDVREDVGWSPSSLRHVYALHTEPDNARSGSKSAQ